MFRTRAAALNQDLTPRPVVTHTGLALPCDLRLRWAIRNGRLMARWEREPHEFTEGHPRTTGRAVAA